MFYALNSQLWMEIAIEIASVTLDKCIAIKEKQLRDVVDFLMGTFSFFEMLGVHKIISK